MRKRKNTGRGNGYNWDEGKSNNALSAEEQGLVLAGEIAKKLKCTSDFIQKNAPFEEWHHVSGWYNKKRYYNMELIMTWWDKEGTELWKEEEARLLENQSKTGSVCKIRFTDWITRKQVHTYECEASILKQGKRLTQFTIHSDVWLVNRKKYNVNHKRIEVSDKFLKGQQMNKKIEFIDSFS